MRTFVTVLLVLVAAAPALAQDAPRYSVEVVSGYHPFLVQGIDHVAVGGASRIRLGRWHLGPELVYLKGPDFDDDLVLNATAVFDLIRGDDAVPFLVFAGGMMHHWGEFDRQSGWTPYVDFGGGARIKATERVFATVETRIGFEWHARLMGSVGWKFGR